MRRGNKFKKLIVVIMSAIMLLSMSISGISLSKYQKIAYADTEIYIGDMAANLGKSFAGTLGGKLGTALVGKAFSVSGLGSVGEFLGLVDPTQRKLDEILNQLEQVRAKLEEMEKLLYEIKTLTITSQAKNYIDNFFNTYGSYSTTAKSVYENLFLFQGYYQQVLDKKLTKEEYNAAMDFIFRDVYNSSYTNGLIEMGDRLIQGSLADGGTVTMCYYKLKTQEVKYNFEVIGPYLEFQEMVLNDYSLAIYMASAGLKFIYEADSNPMMRAYYSSIAEKLHNKQIELMKYYYGQNEGGKPELCICREKYDIPGADQSKYATYYVMFDYGKITPKFVAKNAGMNNGVKEDFIYLIPGGTQPQALVVNGLLTADKVAWDSETPSVAVVNMVDGKPMVTATGVGFTKIKVYTKYYETNSNYDIDESNEYYVPEDKYTYFYVIVTPSTDFSSPNYYKSPVIQLGTKRISTTADISALSGDDLKAADYNWHSSDNTTAEVSGTQLIKKKDGKVSLIGTKKDASENIPRVEMTVFVDKFAPSADDYYHVKNTEDFIWALRENLPIALDNSLDFKSEPVDYQVARDYTSHLNGQNYEIKNMLGALVTINSGIIERINLGNYRSIMKMTDKYLNSSFIGLNYGFLQLVNITSGYEVSVCRLNFNRVAYCFNKCSNTNMAAKSNGKIVSVNESGSLVIGCSFSSSNSVTDTMREYNTIVRTLKANSKIIGCFNTYGTIVGNLKAASNGSIISCYSYPAIYGYSSDMYYTKYFDNCISLGGSASSYGNKEELENFSSLIGQNGVTRMNKRGEYWKLSSGNPAVSELPEYIAAPPPKNSIPNLDEWKQPEYNGNSSKQTRIIIAASILGFFVLAMAGYIVFLKLKRKAPVEQNEEEQSI